MKKLICLLASLPVLASATGMAVSLENLYLQNNTNKATVVTIKNLPEKANRFKLAAKSSCKVNQPIMFQPFQEESNNFVIMVENNDKVDPIVIDQMGLLALAHDSLLKLPSSGNVKGYSLLGFCGNKLGQYKFINIDPHNNDDGAPNFTLKNCSNTSNYVYFINDNYIKVKSRPKAINFSKIEDCETVDSQS